MTPDLRILIGFVRGVLLSLRCTCQCLHSGSRILSGFSLKRLACLSLVPIILIIQLGSSFWLEGLNLNLRNLMAAILPATQMKKTARLTQRITSIQFGLMKCKFNPDITHAPKWRKPGASVFGSVSNVVDRNLHGKGMYMGDCQNYGPFLDTLNIRCRIIIGIQKGTINLTTTHISMLTPPPRTNLAMFQNSQILKFQNSKKNPVNFLEIPKFQNSKRELILGISK